MTVRALEEGCPSRRCGVTGAGTGLRSRALKRPSAKLQLKMRNIRRDILHKATAEICKNHVCISVEALRLKHMTQSAAGSVGENLVLMLRPRPVLTARFFSGAYARRRTLLSTSKSSEEGFSLRCRRSTHHRAVRYADTSVETATGHRLSLFVSAADTRQTPTKTTKRTLEGQDLHG